MSVKNNVAYCILVILDHSFTESDYTRCCINTIWPPDDEHNAARNM